MSPEGVVKADSRGRIAVGRYLEDVAGKFFRIVRLEDGTLTVKEIAA